MICFSLTAVFTSKVLSVSEYFYLVPLEKIDKMIDEKLELIDQIVKWKPKFRVSWFLPWNFQTKHDCGLVTLYCLDRCVWVTLLMTQVSQ